MTKRILEFWICVALVTIGHNVCMVQAQCRSFDRITDNLREVVMGKCTLYQNYINQAPFCDSTFRNCSDIWEKFSSAFAHKPLCNVSDAGYDGYINATDHPTPPNKSLFWENMYPFVHRFSHSGAKYTTLSDTLTGYIGNGLNWCSDPSTTDGMAAPDTECPGWDPTPACPQHALRAFWIAASRSFGLRARGEVTVMLNGSTSPAFGNDTYFSVYELPYWKQGIVTKVTVLMVNERAGELTNRCNDPSLHGLAEQVAKKNIQYECVQNRRDVADLLCLDNPSSPLCSSTSGVASQCPRRSPISPVMVGAIICLATAFRL